MGYQIRSGRVSQSKAELRASAEREISKFMAIESRLDRIQLIPRRDLGAWLECLKRDYKETDQPVALNDQGELIKVTFYDNVAQEFEFHKKETLEYIQWYKLCLLLPQLIFLPVPKWSKVRELMVDRVLWNAASAAKERINRSQHKTGCSSKETKQKK